MQSTLERAISETTGEDVRLVGSGRTDAGAHALGQVVAFSTRSALPVETLLRAINAHLPQDVAVVHVSEASPDFHPRYDANARAYRYLIWNRPVRSPLWNGRAAHVKPHLDADRMHAAAQLLVGEHDFSAFVAVTDVKRRERRMYRAECRREGHLISIELEASGFMRQMVRAIAGTLVEVGRGKLGIDDFQRILLTGMRSEAADTAPAHGLYLVGVRYGTRDGEMSAGTESSVLAQTARPRTRGEEKL